MTSPKNIVNVIEVTEDNNKLPNIYWTPTTHKYLSKARVIIADLHCSIKSLSNDVTAAVKLMCQQTETYKSKSNNFQGSHYYIISRITFLPAQQQTCQ